MKYLDVSGKAFNTIGGNDLSFFEDINEIIRNYIRRRRDTEFRCGALA
jgi:hypothetical protein